jgi:hypothetical protein
MKKLMKLYEKPLIKSLIDLIPYAGSSINTLISSAVEKYKTERLTVFYDELANGKIELTDDIVQKEDFLHCYFSTIEAVLKTKRREKIEYFGRLFNRAITTDIIEDTDQYEDYLNMLDELTYYEIEVLLKLHRLEETESKTFKRDPNTITNSDLYYDIKRNEVMFGHFKDINDKLGISKDNFTFLCIKAERTGAVLYFRPRGSMDGNPIYAVLTKNFKDLLKLILKE